MRSIHRLADSAAGAWSHFIWHGYPNSLIQRHAGHVVQHGLPGYFVSVAGVLEVFGGGLLILGFLNANRRVLAGV